MNLLPAGVLCDQPVLRTFSLLVCFVITLYYESSPCWCALLSPCIMNILPAGVLCDHPVLRIFSLLVCFVITLYYESSPCKCAL
jgi:hypothetical protein